MPAEANADLKKSNEKNELLPGERVVTMGTDYARR
jgi:hypothetical protein